MTGIARVARADLTLIWVAKFGLHVGLLFLGFILAYELRRPLPIIWWTTHPDALRVIGWAGLYALIGAGVELIFQSERSAWRFASMREVVGLVRNVTVTTGLFLGVIFFLDRGVQLPRSILPLTWLVNLALLVGSRMIWRLPHDPGLVAHFLPSWWPRPSTDRTPLLIVGPMAAVDRQLRLIQGDPDSPYQPVGVITPHPEEVGLRLHGVPFIGDLATWLPAHSGLTTRGARPHAIVFLDDPVQAYGFSTERIGELHRAGHTLLKPQTLTEIGGAPGTINLLKEIPLEDFLARKVIYLDPAPIHDLVAGRRVLVTGAGGSIGSELCRQLLALGCAHLSMVDHSEFLLFEIDRELEGPASRRAILANVRDADRIADVVRTERPDIIFHAAALKHVALVENNPAEGVLTNVLGTWNVIKAAVANQVNQFVLISTDKAVAPTNVMGATKRIAEALLELAPKGATRMAAVRFGNVLGSAGSVVPIFRDQIARGGPVTVTHPEVNRFFMTIPEAVQLVLHSAAIGTGARAGEPRKFLLEMGEPVKIADLARQMIELSGKIPGKDVVIEFSGLKPGEKLSEVLSDEGEDVRTCIEGIMELFWRRRLDAVSLTDILALVDRARLANDLPDGRVLEIAERLRGVPRETANV
ncbi:MAG: nucleoside-diphosphate sugar epimerase/dehydratase [Brevundimonas sp.]|uniref:polysaccharide biosynthesis protein n=1 Tax=Brevundimonas sp. TaxID=1871086 RepID=UPI002487D78A|nr:nucleoside-diphosphate sugar epimerase/dehydratase [Brevundimonas sp.]MDI1325523.1 nucleoside-diphosphate sugar epimerase/dehydratase [Brevundimonas sp.]